MRIFNNLFSVPKTRKRHSKDDVFGALGAPDCPVDYLRMQPMQRGWRCPACGMATVETMVPIAR